MRQAFTKRPTDAHLTTMQVRTVRRRTPLAVSASVGTALCAFTLSAAAQNVTLYGTVDAGVVAVRNDAPKAGNQTLVGSGIASPSRWGIRGKEDLGGGLSAIFQLESGFDTDTGEMKPFAGNPSSATPTLPNGTTGTGFNRRASLGLTGDFGQILIGRDYSPLYYAGYYVDVMHFGFFGNLQSIVQAAGGLERLARLSNGLFYTSPVIGGFKARAVYSFGSEGSGGAGGIPKRANTFYGLGGEYTNGGLNIHATYQKLNYPEVAGKPAAFTGNVLSRWDAMLGAIYTTGPFSVSTSYWKVGNPQNAQSAAVGVSYAFGANKVYAQMQRLEQKGLLSTSRNANIFGVAFTHDLSRRTQLYASYGHIQNRSNAAFALLASDLYIAPTAAGQTPSAFGMGIKHDF